MCLFNSVKTDLMEIGANSTLLVAKVNKTDSGNYTCSIGEAQQYTVLVHVLNGKIIRLIELLIFVYIFLLSFEIFRTSFSIFKNIHKSFNFHKNLIFQKSSFLQNSFNLLLLSKKLQSLKSFNLGEFLKSFNLLKASILKSFNLRKISIFQEFSNFKKVSILKTERSF